jgi:hypothetical protein
VTEADIAFLFSQRNWGAAAGRFAESLSLADMASSGNSEPSKPAVNSALARTAKEAKSRQAPRAAKTPARKTVSKNPAQKKAQKKAHKAWFRPSDAEGSDGARRDP